MCCANILKKVRNSETRGICLPTTSYSVLYLLSPNVEVSVIRETDRPGRGGGRAWAAASVSWGRPASSRSHAHPGWKSPSFVGLKFVRLIAWSLFIHKEIRKDEARQGDERPGEWWEAVLGDTRGAQKVPLRTDCGSWQRGARRAGQGTSAGQGEAFLKVHFLLRKVPAKQT